MGTWAPHVRVHWGPRFPPRTTSSVNRCPCTGGYPARPAPLLTQHTQAYTQSVPSPSQRNRNHQLNHRNRSRAHVPMHRHEACTSSHVRTPGCWVGSQKMLYVIVRCSIAPVLGSYGHLYRSVLLYNAKVAGGEGGGGLSKARWGMSGRQDAHISSTQKRGANNRACSTPSYGKCIHTMCLAHSSTATPNGWVRGTYVGGTPMCWICTPPYSRLLGSRGCHRGMPTPSTCTHAHTHIHPATHAQ